MSLYSKKAILLKADNQSGHQYESLLISEIKSIEANAYIRNHDGLHAFALKFSLLNSKKIPLRELKGRGFDIFATKDHSIIIQLTESSYRHVFFRLCDDICTLIANSPNEEEVLGKCISRLSVWRKFFQREKPDGLSREEIIGLFGELTVLTELLSPVLPLADALGGWKGYTKADHDLQFENLAIEVKTTTVRTPEKVYISNIQQLDNHNIPALLLCVVHLKETTTSGQNLPQLVEKIRLQLDQLERNDFDDALIEAGYLDDHKELYEDLSFLLTRYFLYRVEEGFPRLTHDQVPEGVKEIEYQISLDAAAPYAIDKNEITVLFGDN
ncbi:PD-(D/E)XK motif protein [Gammaproteobacteria bacterium]|nr:PD-(D/E)XK motif protein [Gammaproteobacteria bacterium]